MLNQLNELPPVWVLSCVSKWLAAEHFLSLGAAEWFIASVGSFMSSLSGLILNMCSHTKSNRMVLQWCELFHVSLHCLIEEWEQLTLEFFALQLLLLPAMC